MALSRCLALPSTEYFSFVPYPGPSIGAACRAFGSGANAHAATCQMMIAQTTNQMRLICGSPSQVAVAGTRAMDRTIGPDRSLCAWLYEDLRLSDPRRRRPAL